MSRTISRPVFLPSEGEVQHGTPIHFDADKTKGQSFTEGWLQNLIHTHPTLIPVEQVEPAFDNLIPVCCELPTPSGFLDNLFVTPTGYLVLAECKLWRNPESRRKVVAQILDYGKDLAGWGYDDLTHAINRANGTNSPNPLYEVVKDHPDALLESEFHDHIVRGLRTGRYLLLIVGDGIQEGVEGLTNYIQQHMGLHFTLALVEVKLYQLQEGLLVVPYVIAKTENVERAVLRVETSDIKVVSPASPFAMKSTLPKKVDTLTQGDFYETLEANLPGSTAWLRGFLARCESELNITAEIKKTLILRWSADGETYLSLGVIENTGRLATNYADWKPNSLGLLEQAHAYQRELAHTLGGRVQENAPSYGWMVQVGGHKPTLTDLMGKEDAILRVFAAYLASIRQAKE
jgi:hypothetical protein